MHFTDQKRPLEANCPFLNPVDGATALDEYSFVLRRFLHAPLCKGLDLRVSKDTRFKYFRKRGGNDMRRTRRRKQNRVNADVKIRLPADKKFRFPPIKTIYWRCLKIQKLRLVRATFST